MKKELMVGTQYKGGTVVDYDDKSITIVTPQGQQKVIKDANDGDKRLANLRKAVDMLNADKGEYVVYGFTGDNGNIWPSTPMVANSQEELDEIQNKTRDEEGNPSLTLLTLGKDQVEKTDKMLKAKHF